MKVKNCYFLIIVLMAAVFMMSCFEKPVELSDEVLDSPFDMESEEYQPDLHLTVSFFPTDGTTDVSLNSDIILTFSRPVITDGWIVNINNEIYNTGQFNAEGTVLTIKPIFSRGEIVSVNLNNFFSDDSYNVVLEKNCRSFNFQISNVLPIIISTSPVNEEKYVDLKPNIIITFSELMNTVNDWNVTVNEIAYDKNSLKVNWTDKILSINVEEELPKFNRISISFNNFRALIDNYPLSGELNTRFITKNYWTSELLNKIDYFGQNSSISVDSADHIHTCYIDVAQGDAKLQYMTNESGAWIITPIDSADWYENASLVLDSIDKVHISYSDTHNNLKYATNVSGSWNVYALDSEGSIEGCSSITIDSQDNIHSFYEDGSYHFKYITNSSGSWNDQVIDTNSYVGHFSSAAVDSKDIIHACYYTKTGLNYTTNISGSWVIYTIVTTNNFSGEETGYFPSIALDSNDIVHIAYSRPWPDPQLRYISNRSGSWISEIVDYVWVNKGTSSSIALDSNNYVHVSYYDEDTDDLKYATNKFGDWYVETIDSEGYAGSYSSIAIDSNDMVHISYFYYINSSYKYFKYVTNK